MNAFLRTVCVIALLIPLTACSKGVLTPTVPSQAAATASILTIDGFTSLSAKGETGHLTALVTYSDGSLLDQSNLARWSLDDQTVAMINSAGLVTALSDGHTTVTATFGSLTGTRTIRVDLPIDQP